MIFPWQIQHWNRLWQVKLENRIPHALLFAGMKGIGKVKFAETFSSALLCQQPSVAKEKELYPLKTNDHQTVCSCHSCHLIATRAHPNVLWIEPEVKSRVIKIDQIRTINEFVMHSSLQGDYRVVILNSAHSMNGYAANALLKTLEEPAPDSIIILITEQPANLLPTIMSRCQHIHFSKPSFEQAMVWLKQQETLMDQDSELLLRLSNGAPLTALQLIQNDLLTMRQHLFQLLCALTKNETNPIQSAAHINLDLLPFLDFMISWMMDLVRLQLCNDSSMIINQDFKQQLISLTQKSTVKVNIKLIDFLLQLRKNIHKGINLNKQLMMEWVLIRWMSV